MNAGFLVLLQTPLALFWRHRELTYEMARREIKDRYADQLLGSIWAFCHPVLMVALYIFIFKFVFRLGAPSETGSSDYIVYLLSGMIPWMSIQDSLNKTTNVLVSNSRLVKQIVFPIEILPLKTVLASFVNQVICTGLLVCYVMATSGLTATYLLLPVLWIMQLLIMVGIGFILSAVGTYLRDLRDMVQLFCVIGLYTMPVCYTPELVPESLRFLLYLNPFSHLIWCYQDVCFFGSIEHPISWGLVASGSVLISYVGFYLFQRVKIYFGNVL